MKVTQITRRLLPALTFACAMGVAPLAMAQTAAAPDGTMAPAATTTTTTAAPAATTTSTTTAPATTTTTSTPAVTSTTKTSVAAVKLTKADEFTTVAAAQDSCPGATVVWTSLSKSKIYHLSTSKLYGKTKHGAYVCETVATAAGYHASKN